MPASPSRLVLLGSILVDVVLFVPQLPEHGGDVLASDSVLSPGGGFNVLAASVRQGLPAAYAGRHGRGSFGDLVRDGLRREGIAALLPADDRGDTGFCVGLVDATGERTYATRVGVEGSLSDTELTSLTLHPSDLVYLSGYQLAYRHGPAVAQFFADLDETIMTVFDPGPLVGELPRELLQTVLARTDWLSANVREATTLTGESEPATAARRLSAHAGRGGGVIVRAGADGCWLAGRSSAPTLIPAPRVVPVDTSGAGDTHVGAFAAALARGLEPDDACRWANAAAAWCVTRRGPATAPTLEETRRYLG